MQPKPKHDKAEHDKTEHDKTEHSTTPSPTELVHSPGMDYYFEQNAAYENDGSDDDDAMATDEAAAMAELVQEASAANMTLQVLLAVKRPREEPEHIESAESEAELVKKAHRRRGRVKNILSHFDQMSRFVPLCPVSRAPGGKNPEKCYGHYGRPLVW